MHLDTHGEPLPRIFCSVCGAEVTINADRGKHSNDFTNQGPKRYRFFCAQCAHDCYNAAVKRGQVLEGWILAPRWFGEACVTLDRHKRKEA